MSRIMIAYTLMTQGVGLCNKIFKKTPEIHATACQAAIPVVRRAVGGTTLMIPDEMPPKVVEL